VLRRIWPVAAAVALGSGATVAAAPKPPPAPDVSPAEWETIREAAARGILLYAYDQAAWHGTDEMLAKLPDAAGKVGGWIVDGPANAPELVFFDKDSAAPHAVFVADFRDGKLVSTRAAAAGEPELSLERKHMIAARTAALAALQAKGFEHCTQAAMNTVVLPPLKPGDATYVYVLTPQTDLNTIPFGGHYRIAVGPDGSVGEIRAFTNSCIAVSRTVPKGGKPVALVITHLLDPVPTEIHVFSSLVAQVPVMVATKDRRIWAVSGGAIMAIGRLTP
jgi:hypothetical protein